MQLWGAAISAGVPNSLFWELTFGELEVLLKNRAAAERREYLRAGLIAATVVNVNRRKGSPLVNPEDFFREKRSEADYMSVEEAQTALDWWAGAAYGAPVKSVEGLEGNTLE